MCLCMSISLPWRVGITEPMHFVVFTPPPFSHHCSIFNYLSLYRGCGLAYPYDWRGFVGAKKKTSVGLLLMLIPRWYKLSWEFQIDSWVRTSKTTKILILVPVCCLWNIFHEKCWFHSNSKVAWHYSSISNFHPLLHAPFFLVWVPNSVTPPPPLMRALGI